MGVRQALQRGSVPASLDFLEDVSPPDSEDSEDDAKPLLVKPAAARRGSRVALSLYALTMVLFCASYVVSLRGGAHSRDLKWINAHMRLIAGSLATTVATFTAGLWTTVAFAGGHRRWAWPARGALVALSLAFLAYDHGNDFQYHGLYNWLLLWVIAVPLNLGLAGLYLWYRALTPKCFALSLVGSGLVSAALVALALVHFRHQWYAGFNGRRMEVGCPPGGCSPDSPPDCTYLPNLPWVDLLPQGAQNFWTGSQHCKATQHFKAEFSDDGLLTIRGCSHPEHMSYTQLPDTKRWPTDWKRFWKASYQNHVLGHMKPVKYTSAVRLNSTEAVLARCGSEERLLVRVKPLRERKAPEPPLAQLQPPSGSLSDGGRGATAEAVAKEGKAGSGGAGSPAPAAAPSGPRLNVVVMFIDSVSRRHFFRRLPLTAKALEEVDQQPGAEGAHLYQFFRYHTVGFSTDPNSHAMYTGTTYPNPGSMPVWEAYRRAGYVSGSVYNLCEGWGADYNDMATAHDHEMVAPFCDPEYHPVNPDGEPYQIFKGAFSILRRCLRGRHVHQYNYEYARKFMQAYEGVTPYFLLNTLHEGHEGTGEVLATIDSDTADFVRELTPEQLNSTLFIMLADHGLTMGLNYLFTSNGKVEHKNPFLAMLAPRWLKSAYPQLEAALHGNEQRLLSAFDIFTTLHHVLHLGSPNPEMAAAAAAGGGGLRGQYPAWAAAGNVSSQVQWGTSLLAPIPRGRTCEEAWVPADNCMCF